MATPHVVVVGGGITGLSTAFYLMKEAKQNGMEMKLTLVEKGVRFGGKIQTYRRDGFIMEEGPDSFLARKTAALDLCKDLGIDDQLNGTNPDARKNYILRNNKLHLMPPGTMLGIPAEITPFVRSSLISPAGKIRAAMDLFLPRGDSSHDESLGLFLRRRLGDELVDQLVDPLLSGIYAGNADLLSLQATFPMFHQIEKRDRSLILGIVKQRNSQKGSGVPREPEKKHTSIFLALESGFDTLVTSLVERLKQEGADLIPDTSVTRLERVPQEDTGNGSGIQYRLKLTDHPPLDADAVVLTTPAFVSEKLLSPYIETNPLAQIPYVSVATIGLAYPRAAIKHPLDGSGFVIPHKAKRFITACTWVSSKWLHTAPRDKVLLRCFVGHSGDESHVSLSDEEVVRGVRNELKSIMGIDAEPEWTKVIRWNQAMPQYLVDHLSRMKKLQSDVERELPGLTLAGAGYYGVGVPDCIAQGKQAAGQVLEQLQKEIR